MKNFRYLPVYLLATLQPATSLAADELPVEEVVVYGQRAMLQNAIAIQRDADVIKSVITRDAIGQFPDQNVAEAVRRLPGVNVLNDQGEGRFIAVRGLDPSLNGASINGTRLPAPESDTRSVALDVVASELVESIEIIKLLTPDMDADTIGAAININTTSAFDADKAFITIKVEESYTDLNEETSPKGSLDFVYPVSERLGISGGLSYAEREFSTDNIEADDWDTSDAGIVYAATMEYRDYDVLRERTGATFSVDYKLSDASTLYGRVLYSQFDDTEERKRLTIELDQEPTTGAGQTAAFSSEDGEIAVERDIKDRFESQEIYTYQFGGETRLEDWLFEYQLSFAHAEEHEHKTQDPTRFSAAFEDPGVVIVFNYADMEEPSYQVAVGQSTFLDPATYEFDKLERVNGKAEDDEFAARFDATRTFLMDSGSVEMRFGAKVRQRSKEFDLLLEVYDGYGGGDLTLADVLGSQSYGLASIDPLPGLSQVRRFTSANFSDFELNPVDTAFESALEDYEVDEDVTAAYVMARWEDGPLMIVGGVRFEKTENDIRANLVELVEEDGTRNGVVLTEDTVFITPQRFNKSYTDWMPSASLRYEFTDEILLRAGFFKSIVRPNISSLAPRFVVEEADDGEREGQFGNPDLDPYVAWNFDASIEWYLSADSVIQFGVFNKQIEDFIVEVEFEGVDAPYNGIYNGVAFNEALIPLNGDEATVNGFEFNYQQVLTDLPAPFDGFIVGLNYTYTDTEGDIGNRKIPLPAASENNYNAMLGYEKGPVSIRLTAAYRDEYLDEVGGAPDEDRYVEEHLQWDLTASYAVTEQFRVYAQFVNMNDEPYIAFRNGPVGDRLYQYEEYSWTAKLGLQANF